jgi:hypothetical protein
MEAHRELRRQADFNRECPPGARPMSGLAFGIAAKSAGGFLFRAGAGALRLVSGIDWAKMWWIVPLGAAIVFALVERGEAVHLRKLDQRDAAGWAGEKKAHAVTKASLDRALAQIADNNKRVDAAAAELGREKARAAADLAQADARWRTTKAGVDALEADARDLKRAPCTVSAAAKQALEGL